MKLALFDFDNTLFKTPYNEDPSYMDKPESLYMRKWKFEPILETIKKFKECKKHKHPSNPGKKPHNPYYSN